MKVVINISKKIYESSKAICKTEKVVDIYTYAIARGTPLPEHHGDLKDVNDIWNNVPDVNVLTNYFTTYDIQHFIDDAPTIIEADKEVKYIDE